MLANILRHSYFSNDQDKHNVNTKKHKVNTKSTNCKPDIYTFSI